MSSSFNTISENNITNEIWGVSLSTYNAADGSSFNTVSENNIIDNDIGILLGISWSAYVTVGNCSHNAIFHNNFVDNYQHVLSGSSTNSWNEGYPHGGNYWSDYSGADLYRGPYQNVTGSDGVGDTPYTIDANNTDYYPLMDSWSPHDVALTDVVPCKTVVGQGCVLNIKVPVDNLGDYTTTFNITVYANEVCLASAFTNITLSGGASIILVFVCNTASLAYGNYTISAYAWPVTSEANTANNNCTGGWIIVSLPGDITGPNGWPDGIVDIRDISYVARRFQCLPGNSLWDPNADINGDGKIDMKDVGIAARNYGEHYP